MDLFDLPQATVVNRVVPKNSFDAFTNARQRALFTSHVLRILWANKLASQTVNLAGDSINEIQVFRIELKVKNTIPDLLKVIDRAIPYAVIFQVQFGPECYLSAAKKRPHATLPDQSIVEHVFRTDWFTPTASLYRMELRSSLDEVFLGFCKLLVAEPNGQTTLEQLASREQERKRLNREIERLTKIVNGAPEFSKRVEANLELKKRQDDLNRL